MSAVVLFVEVEVEEIAVRGDASSPYAGGGLYASGDCANARTASSALTYREVNIGINAKCWTYTL